MFADAAGHSVIVEGDEMIHSEAPYQIATNFYQSEVDDHRKITYWLIPTAVIFACQSPAAERCT